MRTKEINNKVSQRRDNVSNVHNQSVRFKDNRNQSISNIQKMANDLVQMKSNNTGLPNQLKSGIESLSGYSMDDVKVHYNSSKPAQLNAHAYAQGTDIHVASGQEKHLAHEAWHVVQQKQGRVQPTRQLMGKVHINDDAGLEREADVMGAKALQMKNRVNRGDKRNIVNPILQRYSVKQVAQLNRSSSRVKQIGEKIAKKESQKVDKAQLKRKNGLKNSLIQLRAINSEKVIQRLVNAPINLGNPYTFHVVPADLGTGTGTTVGTRAYVNNPATPKHLNIDWAYGVWNGAGVLTAANNGTAPNPAPVGNYQAGHSLGRQNGGLGGVNTWVFPQNPTVNMGWG